MKRHPCLRSLSDDHHHGLVQARRLRLAAESDPEARSRAAHEFISVWRLEISPHFDREEMCLLSYLNGDAQANRLLSDHAVLRGMAESLSNPATVTAELCKNISDRLETHIRWEERELFPALELSLPEESLRIIGQNLAEDGTPIQE